MLRHEWDATGPPHHITCCLTGFWAVHPRSIVGLRPLCGQALGITKRWPHTIFVAGSVHVTSRRPRGCVGSEAGSSPLSIRSQSTLCTCPGSSCHVTSFVKKVWTCCTGILTLWACVGETFSTRHAPEGYSKVKDVWLSHITSRGILQQNKSYSLFKVLNARTSSPLLGWHCWIGGGGLPWTHQTEELGPCSLILWLPCIILVLSQCSIPKNWKDN